MANRADKAALAIFFISITVAVIIAYQSPSTNYELSIYHSTPVGFWIGIGISLTGSIIYTIFAGSSRYYRWCGVLSGALAVFTIMSVPLLRGYYYYGWFDALTHFGSLVTIFQTNVLPTENIYPQMIVLGSALSSIGSITPQVSLLIVLLTSIGLYLIWVPLFARLISDRDPVTWLAAVSAWLLLPIMSVRLPTPYPIPNTIAVFLLPVILYGTILYIQRPSTAHFSIFVVMVFLAIISHPIIVLVLAILLSGIWVLYRIPKQQQVRYLYRIDVLPAFVGVLLLAWLIQFNRVFGIVAKSWIPSIIATERPAGEVSSAGESLGRINVSLTELLIRTMTPKFIFMIFVAGLFLWYLSRIFQSSESDLSQNEWLQLYLAVSLMPIGIGSLLFIIIGLSNQATRYLGSTMGVVTVIGAISLAVGIEKYKTNVNKRAKITLFLFISILLVISLTAVHPSPAVVRPNQHVTEQHVDGFAHAFEHRSSDQKISSSYLQPRRFRQVHYGIEEAAGRGDGSVPPTWEVIAEPIQEPYSEHFESRNDKRDLYIITDASRNIHLNLFQGEVQTEKDFRAFETHTNRIYSNGGTDLYSLD